MSDETFRLEIEDWVTPVEFVKRDWEHPTQLPLCNGMPVQIKGIDRPFVIVQNLDSTWFTFDLRTVKLQKMSELYVQTYRDAVLGQFKKYVPMEVETQKKLNNWLQNVPSEELDEIEKEIKNPCPRCGGPMRTMMFEGSDEWVLKCYECNNEIGDTNEK